MNNGSADITTGGVTLSKPEPPDNYLVVARALLPSLRLLESEGYGRALIAAHTTECILKAYLTRDREIESKDKARKIGHDIKELWNFAKAEGLQKEMPDWATMLSCVHKSPYQLRYAEKAHGIWLPSFEPMVSEIESLVLHVEKIVRSQRS